MKNRNYIILLAFMFLFSALSGCGKAKSNDPVLLTIGKTVVTESTLNERINNLPERYREIIKKKKVEYIQEFINDTLLYQEAVRKGIDKVDDVKKVVEEAKKKIVIARLLQDEVEKEIKITDEEIKDFYDKNQKMYMTPEIMRVSHILVPTREEAEKIVAELANGANFEEMAKAKSVDPTAQRAGDIGYFPKGQLMTEFEDACARLDKGEISGVVKTKLGYHIIKLTDRRAPELRKLDTVIEDIKARIHDIKRRELFNELLDKLKKETEIVVNEKALSSQEETGETAGPAADTLNAQSTQNKEEQ